MSLGLVSFVTFLCAAAPVSDGARAHLRFTTYSVLFDQQKQGFPATSATLISTPGELRMLILSAIEDDEAGGLTYVTRSADTGRTWTLPDLFGSELRPALIKDPAREFLWLAMAGPTRRQTVLSVGYHLARGAPTGDRAAYDEAERWRPGTALIGRQEFGRGPFAYQQYPTGAFLGEQFVAPGIVSASGRVLLTVWGAMKKGENWRAGVLLSDDDGRNWRYRETGYQPDPAIRNDPKTPAGFNEQTLFEAAPGRVIAIMRGREGLGRVADSPRDTFYLRAESLDAGETWSRPAPVNMAGTGAPAAGLTLPDGSLLTASRVPYSRTLYPLPEKDLFGLIFFRSFDQGKNWQVERFVQHDPQGVPFDNHYNAMNGQFVQIAAKEYVYAFAQFSMQSKVYRVLAIKFQVE